MSSSASHSFSKVNEVRLILGDQLNHDHSWFRGVRKDVLYVMIELPQEQEYVRHHIQKTLCFFLAMRAFANHLQKAGHQVLYIALDSKDNPKSLAQHIDEIVQRHSPLCFAYQLPDEYRLDKLLQSIGNECEAKKIEVNAYDTEHFLTEREDFADFFGDKSPVMERFYRHMRAKFGVLMDGPSSKAKPLGGKWNYDVANRKKWPKDKQPLEPLLFHHDVSALLTMLDDLGVQTIGHPPKDNVIQHPVTRQDHLEMLDFFVDQCLPEFGLYQDAMTDVSWTLYHSRISFGLNTKLLHPLEVIRKVEERFIEDPDHASIEQVEGFIRQILGWREYMRGVYWKHMPTYATLNELENGRKLPSWFWDGKTDMYCQAHAIGQSLDHAYAHHIQRLMVTGNFTLLAGIEPSEVDAWYLGIYLDAIEWVQMPNTRGMSQFADGGIVGTKPYVASANYMSKMGDYCKKCSYNAKLRHGEKACPLNSLYWDFINRHEEKLASNRRMWMPYQAWRKFDHEEKVKVLKQAEYYLNNLESL
ncbi:MAG: cryptochrome/photolyase family protein [Bacteroidota bacterium]|nr:cryptochrome/photolyase family protein [Bacteroidota bacterium]